MKLVVGLGNPGRRYDKTRHNAGFLVVERLAARWAITADRKQLGSLAGDGLIAQERATLVRPQSFMNLSGQPVRAMMDFLKLDVADIVVVHDEVDLPFGSIRVKQGGGHGGHNGLRDLLKHIGPEFARVRVGVSRPPEGWDTADYVLGSWTDDESAALPGHLDDASDAVESVLREGVLPAMNRHNPKTASRPSNASAGKAASQ